MQKITKLLKRIIVGLFSILFLFYMIFVLGPIILAQILMFFSNNSYHPVSDNSNDIWIGGSDGGVFLEIISSKLPYYCIRVKSEDGAVIESGKIYFNDGELAEADFNLYNENIDEGKNGIILKNYQVLLIEHNGHCELLIEK